MNFLNRILMRRDQRLRNDPPAEIFRGLRENALRMEFSGALEEQVCLVLMDWHVGSGWASVLAAVDGTASIYLSSGGGHLGGGQRHASIRDAAHLAIESATGLLSYFNVCDSTPLPDPGTVHFYVKKGNELLFARASEEKLSQGSDPLLQLGNIMQMIVTNYRQLSVG
jgi:hypothetical protein